MTQLTIANPCKKPDTCVIPIGNNATQTAKGIEDKNNQGTPSTLRMYGNFSHRQVLTCASAGALVGSAIGLTVAEYTRVPKGSVEYYAYCLFGSSAGALSGAAISIFSKPFKRLFDKACTYPVYSEPESIIIDKKLPKQK